MHSWHYIVSPIRVQFSHNYQFLRIPINEARYTTTLPVWRIYILSWRRLQRTSLKWFENFIYHRSIKYVSRLSLKKFNLNDILPSARIFSLIPCSSTASSHPRLFVFPNIDTVNFDRRDNNCFWKGHHQQLSIAVDGTYYCLILGYSQSTRSHLITKRTHPPVKPVISICSSEVT